VFQDLLQRPDVWLANCATSTTLPPPSGGYWLLESYPTSVWRTSGLVPLAGKARATPHETRAALSCLASTYGFVVESPTAPLSHDDVQALVAALPAAALLGGPAVAIPRGVPATVEVDGSRSEGIIWDAHPRARSAPAAALATSSPADDQRDQEDSAAAGDENNHFLPDERDDAGFSAIVERGRRLLHGLAMRANRGEVAGLGYQQLLLALHDASTLGELLGRPQAQAKWSQAYGMWAMRLAVRITREVGRARVKRGNQEVDAGLDTFVWSTSTRDRPQGAWRQSWTRLPYTREQWEAVFPRPRRLLTSSELRQLMRGRE
jgi:hypothetical protein